MKGWLIIRHEAMCLVMEVLQTLVTWACKQGLLGDTCMWVGGIAEEFS